MKKTTQYAYFLAKPGSIVAQQADALVAARVAAVGRRRAYQDKYGTPGAGYYEDEYDIWVNAEKSPEPKRVWSHSVEYGYRLNGRAKAEMLRERDALRLPFSSEFLGPLNVPRNVWEPFFTRERSPGGGVLMCTSPISLWGHGVACGVYVQWLGELGDDPPWCPPDCVRISEIEYGKIAKAAKEAANA